MALRKRGQTWEWYSQVHVSTGATERQEAERIAETYKAEMERTAGRLASDRMQRRKQKSFPRTVGKAYEAEIEWVGQRVGKVQAGRMVNAIGNFVQWIGSDHLLARVNQTDIQDYYDYRIANVSRATVRKELNGILRMLKRYGLDVSNPDSAPEKERTTEARTFTEDEEKQFFAACQPSDPTLAYVLMRTFGLRLTELIPSPRSNRPALLKDEMDLTKRILNVRVGKRRPNQPAKYRQLRIPESLVEPLREQMDRTHSDQVFAPVMSHGHLFDRILRRAGIRKHDALGRVLTAHSLRHTFASRSGLDSLVLQSVLGHSNAQMTAHYYHPETCEIGLPDTIDASRIKLPARIVEVV